MADNPQTLALITLAQQYGGDIVRQINRTAMAVRTLPIIVGEGKNVAWATEGDGQNAEEYADGADASNFGSDAQASATLNWALMRDTFRVTGLARAAARTTQTPAGNVQLWARNLVNASAKLASLINQRTYGGDGSASPKQITGFDQAIGSTTNTYATIDRTQGANAYFLPYVTDPGAATNVSLGQIRDDIKEIYIQSGEYPDLAFCHPSIFNEIGNLFDSTRRKIEYVDKMTTARGAVTLEGGYRGIEVDGTVFLKDKDATRESGNGAGRIYYVNSNYVDIMVLPQADDLGLMPGTMLQANDGFGELPLFFDYEMLSVTGDSRKAQVKVYTELRVRRPNSCGVRKNVKINT